MQLLSQTTHRQSYVNKLTEDIRKNVSSENLPFHTAATRVLLQWLK